MRLYDKLARQKQNGEKLDMKQVTFETLYQLWWNESCSDGVIADLYDVPKKKVTNLRHKWGVKLPDTIVHEFQERFVGTIPTEEEDQLRKVTSKEAGDLLRKINDLNDSELESLRLELARRFLAFSQIKQETVFLAAVERCVRQFGSKNNDNNMSGSSHAMAPH